MASPATSQECNPTLIGSSGTSSQALWLEEARAASLISRARRVIKDDPSLPPGLHRSPYLGLSTTVAALPGLGRVRVEGLIAMAFPGLSEVKAEGLIADATSRLGRVGTLGSANNWSLLVMPMFMSTIGLAIPTTNEAPLALNPSQGDF